MKRLLSCMIILVTVLMPSLSFSHGGRTDSKGGHYDRKTGKYHYHNSGGKSSSSGYSSFGSSSKYGYTPLPPVNPTPTPKRTYTTKSGDYTYEHQDSGVKITKFKTNSAVEKLIIPNTIDGRPVVSIGSKAFIECADLMVIEISDSLTTIEEGAFYGCKDLITVIIPDSITSIGDSAFSGCEKLEAVVIPDSVTSLGAWAFYGCKQLESIVIPNNITSIGGYVFCFCNSLTSITIPDSVTSIGKSAFSSCPNLVVVCSPSSYSVQYCYTNKIAYKTTEVKTVTTTSSPTKSTPKAAKTSSESAMKPRHTATPSPTLTPMPAPTLFPTIKPYDETKVYYYNNNRYYHRAEDCGSLLRVPAHTLTEALKSEKLACPDCNPAPLDLIGEENIVWYGTDEVFHITDECSALTANWTVIKLEDAMLRENMVGCSLCGSILYLEYRFVP